MDLQEVFQRLAPRRDPNLLVGMETMDDAAIYKVTDEVALVITADFITPITDDPYLFGQIAAANSLSDVYAMGGRPVTVLNLCMFPPRGVDPDTLGKILQGGLDKTHEAGAILVGGHTVRDEEMKYGLSVNGFVHPKRTTPNSGARAGDAFILTKPVGSGVYVNGARTGAVSGAEFEPVVRKLAELNKTACETMMEFEAKGATDITGFGLGGHVLGMARASRIGIRIFYDALPRFPRALDLIEKGVMTAITGPNEDVTAGALDFQGTFAEAEKGLFWDPQTSGGLFFSLRAADAEACLKKLHERGVRDAHIVGEGFAADKPHIEVIRR